MKGELRVVQASILGSIVSNLLLILGVCFVAGGRLYNTQELNQTDVAQTTSSLMTLACIVITIPGAFNYAFNTGDEDIRELLDLSRETAIALLIIYILYFYFRVSSICIFLFVAQKLTPCFFS